MRLRHLAQPVDQRIRVAGRRDRDDEGVEVVVVVLAFGVVMRGPRLKIVFRRGPDAEQHIDVDDALAGRGDLDRARQASWRSRRAAIRAAPADQVGLVEHDEIGAEKLVFVDFLERIVVIERGVGGALLGDARRIVGEAALGDRGGVDDGDDAVDGEPRAQVRPVESLDQRLRQREAGGLDDDMVGPRLARQQRRHGGGEIVGDRAADAAVGELDDRLARAGLVGAALEQVAVDADVAEFVDDEREAPSAGIGEEVTDQRRLAGAEKAGDDGDGGLGEHRRTYEVRAGTSGGVREMTPLRKGSGRSRQGTSPSGAAA